ncbi:LysM peptidoglycan-binding domain-containing protein [Caproiciproducens sp.]|uniref:LysM peptidoglycan-binding domain-containing protein n=1 Tax=Caproiciproducens sp. TaxID=1954376 RepID=UPI00289BE651|nr:LysM peptidoglycan-binding domain-containing protein [Caproiciproducens sp.]
MDDSGRLTSVSEVAGLQGAEASATYRPEAEAGASAGAAADDTGAALSVSEGAEPQGAEASAEYRPAAERRPSGAVQDTPAQALPGGRVRRSAVTVTKPAKNEIQNTALESWINHFWKGKSFSLPTIQGDNSIITFEQATYIKLHGNYYLYHKISDTSARIENSEGENIEIQKENRYVNKWNLSDEKSIKHAFIAEFIHQASINEAVYPELYHSLSEIMKRDNGQDAVTVITNLNRKINEFIFLRGGGQKNNSMLPIFILKLQLKKLFDFDQEQQNKITETEKTWLTTHEIDADIFLQKTDMLLNTQEIDEKIYLTNLERINQHAALEKSKSRLSNLLSDIDKKITHQDKVISRDTSSLQEFLNSRRYKNKHTAFANPIEIDKEKTRLEYLLSHSTVANNAHKTERKKTEYLLSLVETELNPTSSPEKTYLHAIKHGIELKNNLREKYSMHFKDNKYLESFILLKATSDISLEENEILNSPNENAKTQLTSLRVTRNYLIDSYNLQQNFTNLVSKIPVYDYQPLGNHKDINFAKVEALKLFCDMMGIDRPDIKNSDADFQSFVSKHESGRSDLHMLESLIFYKINNKNVDMSILDYSTVSEFFTDKLYSYKNALRFNEPTLPEKYFSLTQFVPGHFYTDRNEFYQQFAEYNNKGSADYDATNLANTLLSDAKLTDEELTKKVEVWKFKMDWTQDEYRVRGMSGMSTSKSTKIIAPVGTGTLIRLGDKHIFIYNVDGNLKTQILDKKEVLDPVIINNYLIFVDFKNGKFTRHNEFYKEMLGDIQPPKQADESARFRLLFSPKETTVSSSAKDTVKKAFKENLSDITNQYKISNDYSSFSYKLAAIFIPLFDKLYNYLYDPTYKFELDAYDALDILTLSTSFASLGFKSIKLSRQTLKGLQAAIKEDRAANLAANVIFENSLKRAAQAASEFNIKFGKAVANEIINIVEPLPIRDMYKYIRREFKSGKIGKNIAGTYNRSTFNNSNVNDEFIRKGVSQDAVTVLNNKEVINASSQKKITLVPDENLPAKSMDFTLSDIDDINIDSKKVLNDIRKDPNIAAMIDRPAGKCEAVMAPVAKFMIKEEFTDIRYRGIYIWANGLDNNPMNHFAVIGKKNGIDYIFDVTAHQFANSGMRDFEDPQILTLLSWEDKWRNATSRKLIVCSDFNNTYLARNNYSSSLPITPVDFFIDASKKNLDYSLITNPPMLNKLKSDNPGIIKTLDKKTKPSSIISHLSDGLEGETSYSTSDRWQSSLSKGAIAGVIINSEHNNRFGIISTPGNKSDTLTLFSHGKSINEDYTIKSPEDLSLHFYTPHRTKLKNPGLGIFVHNNTVPYSVIDGKKYKISFYRDSAMTKPVSQDILRKKLFDDYHQFRSHIISKETKDQLLATGTTRTGEVSNYFFTSTYEDIDEKAFKLAVEANRLNQADLDSLDPVMSEVIQLFAKAPAGETIKGAELTDIMHILPKQAGTLEEVIKIAKERNYKKLKLIHCRVLAKDPHAKTYIANTWKDQGSENTLDNTNKDIESIINIDFEKNNIDIFYLNLKNTGIPFLRRIELQDNTTSMQEEESLPRPEDYVTGKNDDDQPGAVRLVSRGLQAADREYFADVPALPDNYPLDVTDDPALYTGPDNKLYIRINERYIPFHYEHKDRAGGYVGDKKATLYIVKHQGVWQLAGPYNTSKAVKATSDVDADSKHTANPGNSLFYNASADDRIKNLANKLTGDTTFRPNRFSAQEISQIQTMRSGSKNREYVIGGKNYILLNNQLIEFKYLNDLSPNERTARLYFPTSYGTVTILMKLKAGYPSHWSFINTETVDDSPAKPSAVTSAVKPSAVTCTVKPGDNLWSIAGKYYGNKNRRYHLIQKANKTLLSSGLKPGQVLVIPDANVWNVESGDTFWDIATKIYGNGNRYVDIQNANPEIAASGLKPGQKLKLPE